MEPDLVSSSVGTRIGEIGRYFGLVFVLSEQQWTMLSSPPNRLVSFEFEFELGMMLFDCLEFASSPFPWELHFVNLNIHSCPTFLPLSRF